MIPDRSIIKLNKGYKVVCLTFKQTSSGFFEGDWLNYFKQQLVTNKYSEEGNYIHDFEKLLSIEDMDEIPAFYCDLSLRNADLDFLCIRMFTNHNLLGFLSGIDDLLDSIPLSEVFKERGIEFNP